MEDTCCVKRPVFHRAFRSTLRSEVDLDQLREQLLAVVQETMQPTHVSLWVRQPSRTERPTFQIDKSPPEGSAGE